MPDPRDDTSTTDTDRPVSNDPPAAGRASHDADDPPVTEAAGHADPTEPERAAGTGLGRVLVAIYGVMALAATGRSVLQITEYFSRAPLAYILSAVAAVIYIVATVALARGDRTSARVALLAISIEMVGVLVVGLASYLAPEYFPDKTVWSHFGAGYGYVPLVLPAVGLWWLLRGRDRARGADRESS